jgi:hypothetical protein
MRAPPHEARCRDLWCEAVQVAEAKHDSSHYAFTTEKAEVYREPGGWIGAAC